MLNNIAIEDLVLKEVKALCTTCYHRHECSFYKTTTKAIIQCELFQLDEDKPFEGSVKRGLCITCDNAVRCSLPGRRTGVWHCDEFE